MDDQTSGTGQLYVDVWWTDMHAVVSAIDGFPRPARYSNDGHYPPGLMDNI